VCVFVCVIQGSGFGDQGSEFKAQGSVFRVQGSRLKAGVAGFRVHDSRYRAKGSWIRLLASWCRVQRWGRDDECAIARLEPNAQTRGPSGSEEGSYPRLIDSCITQL